MYLIATTTQQQQNASNGSVEEEIYTVVMGNTDEKINDDQKENIIYSYIL